MQWLTLVAIAVAASTALWACWRQPAVALVLAIAAMAVPPDALRGSAPLSPGWGWSHTLLVVALGLVALRGGVRAGANWPVVAVVLAVAASLTSGR